MSSVPPGRSTSVPSVLATDGVSLSCHSWVPAEPRVACLYLHGLGAQSEWITPLAEDLRELGWLTLAPDHRGHGKTGPALGKMPSPARVLRDVESCWKQLGKNLESSFEVPNRVPRVLMGTSLGGILAVAFAAGRRDVDGLILISPAFRPCYLDLGEQFRMALSLLVGGQAPTATPLARGLEICRSKDLQDRLRSDPLSLPALTARSHLNAQLMIWNAEASLGRVTCPVLCLQGAHDSVVDPSYNRKRFENRAGTRFEWIDSGHHDLGLEPENGGITRRISSWTEANVLEGN